MNTEAIPKAVREMARNQLEDMVVRLQRESHLVRVHMFDALEESNRMRREAEDNLTATQSRCTELLEEARALRAKIVRIHGAYREVEQREFIPTELAVAMEETGCFA